MTDIRFVIGKDSITLYMDGENYSVGSDWKEFEEVKELLEVYGGMIEEFPEIKEILHEKLDKKDKLLNLFDSRNIPITIENGLLKYKGFTIRTSLVNRILEVNERNGDLAPFAKFIENLFMNPSGQSINELYMFLERNNLPITEKGNFLAYKKVSLEFLDLHSGKIDNSPGKEVWMHRNDVDTDRNRTCSSGLHVCSKDYLPCYGGDDSSTVVIVEVNPRDVVSVPSDYNDAKMRVCRYTVIKELPEYREHKVSDYFANLEDDEYIEIEPYEDDEPLEEQDVDLYGEDEKIEGYNFDLEEEMDSYPLVTYFHAGRLYEGYGVASIPAGMSLSEMVQTAMENYIELQMVEEHMGIQNKFKPSVEIKPYERKLVLVTSVDGEQLARPRFVAPEASRVEII